MVYVHRQWDASRSSALLPRYHADEALAAPGGWRRSARAFGGLGLRALARALACMAGPCPESARAPNEDGNSTVVIEARRDCRAKHRSERITTVADKNDHRACVDAWMKRATNDAPAERCSIASKRPSWCCGGALIEHSATSRSPRLSIGSSTRRQSTSLLRLGQGRSDRDWLARAK